MPNSIGIPPNKSHPNTNLSKLRSVRQCGCIVLTSSHRDVAKSIRCPYQTILPMTNNSILALFFFTLAGGAHLGTVSAQQPAAEEKKTEPASLAPKSTNAAEEETKNLDDEDENEGKLFFSFGGSRWKEVIEWLADSSDLALHYSDLPIGTFTYSDTKYFTLQEAIDRVNLFLLPEGFTLVRSGRLLSVINLSDPRSLKQLDSLARLVKYEDLETAEDHDVVKCIFPLGDLDAVDAVEELSALNLFQTPAIFSKTNQLMITDTAVKLKTAKKILSAFKPKTLDNGTVVKSFTLDHVDAEDVLMVARPHLGLATGEMIGIDVSISADVKGKNIFVTGIEDKVLLIEGLISQIDKPKLVKTGAGVPELQSYPIPGGNVDVIYNVLITLLAKKEVRLSKDENAGTIVALATPDIQKEIAETVNQLKASESEFAVIQLKSVDPVFAISLLEEMLDISEDEETDDNPFQGGRWWEYGRNSGRQQEKKKESPPKIDADPGNMRLFVRGSKYQIEQIRNIIAEIDTGTVGSGEDLRVFPLTGEKAEKSLKLAAKFWRAKNPIYYYPIAEANPSAPREKTLSDENDSSVETFQQPKPPKRDDKPIAQLLTSDLTSKETAIICQMTSRGILLQSEDTDALDQFEKLLRTVVGPTDTMPAAPTIYYLKYTKPNDALRMLAELLDGGEAAKEGEAGTLVNGYVSGSSSFLGSIVTSREGTLTMINDSITVVADPRLNRLIAQGTTRDIELIEGYLKIVDKDSSITSVETFGTSHIIELEHVSATEVAVAIRDAYFGRVNGTATTGGRQPNGQQPQGGRGNQDNRGNEREGNNRGGENGNNQQGNRNRQQGGGAAVGMEPKMTIAVHEPSNSLIVTAPEQLFKEVEKLAKLIDSRSRQTVEILKLPRSFSGDLKQILAGEAVAPQTRPTSRTRSGDRRQPTSSRGRDR